MTNVRPSRPGGFRRLHCFSFRRGSAGNLECNLGARSVGRNLDRGRSPEQRRHRRLDAARTPAAKSCCRALGRPASPPKPGTALGGPPSQGAPASTRERGRVPYRPRAGPNSSRCSRLRCRRWSPVRGRRAHPPVRGRSGHCRDRANISSSRLLTLSEQAVNWTLPSPGFQSPPIGYCAA